MDLAACCDAWARLPLLFEPGTEFNYSVATDVLGRVGRGRVRADAGHVLRGAHPRPAGHDGHRVRARADADRLAALYGPGLARNDRLGAGGARARRRSSRAAAGWSPPRPTITASRRCCSAGRAGRRAPARAPYAALHGPQPPARRRRAEGRRAADDPETQNDGMGFGLGFSRRAGPGGHEGRRLAGRARVGRAGQHRVLRRPAGAHQRRSSSRSWCRRAPTRCARSCASSSTRRWWTDARQARRRPRLAPVHQRGADAALQGRRVHAAGPAEHDAQGDPAADALPRQHRARDQDRRQAGVGDDEDRPRAGGAACPSRRCSRGRRPSRAPRRGRIPCSRTVCARSRATAIGKDKESMATFLTRRCSASRRTWCKRAVPVLRPSSRCRCAPNDRAPPRPAWRRCPASWTASTRCSPRA